MQKKYFDLATIKMGEVVPFRYQHAVYGDAISAVSLIMILIAILRGLLRLIGMRC